jgi:8-amino-7-oxononanoate synthase
LTSRPLGRENAGMDIWDDMRRELARSASAGMLRSLREVQSGCGPRIRLAGREVVCFSSNDYLGLAADDRVKAAAVEAVGRWGLGAGASRLLSGTSTLHLRLERELAAFKGAEAALATSTGWMANHAALHALAGRGDLVLADKLSHASLLDAAGSSGATLRTYPHGDLRRLAAILERRRALHKRCVIATDSLFSMDGDLADLAALCDLKDRADAILLIDEAHATGVFGPRGAGAAELLGVEHRVDVTVGTLSKAIGALGGFVAGRRAMIDAIVNAGRAFIFTTALPPAICAGAMESLRIIRQEPLRRQRLLELAASLRDRLRSAGLDTGAGASQIIPILVGEAAKAVRLSERLLDEGFYVPAIRPPSVPRGASRLRVNLRADHDEADVSRLAERLIAAVGG